ncbi:cytochrome b [Psychrobacter sanguinis]|uniref:cytochrome b n=1 Tax=Psychrobacter sanguinis TaxID=861445 RepID=UPI0019191098|nr:cytochrome bc complex cytochrome b subunit [Psychrobacter sanguinis]MCC3308198.1 cytochrome bc complex cytochrome b subunit [Psychrobacter sanguinis]MCC3344056.1 cytochrome bc complex cytochrome b subunit [Psychrobacter sanguinis]MCD9151061.1 cytochrome bc complex cytochrome b subunit [Psychrobacter sanguinis]MDY3306896.1 cytochrome bc complex cytochrome b subunit [Psychrobacter sanguinis]UEC26974.1 cytochrome bc complex cytochrome b subunit [Psychrobacter sanguinis]
MGWVDARFPATETYEYHMSKYYAPKNFNFWYFFGVLSMIVLVNQLVTGIWLTMMFNPSAEGAFASVEYIMRDVKGGWLIRYMHSTGASAFFVVVYLHMFRGMLYGSYKKPRELIWLIGMGIYLCLMAEGFFGYLLPWGNMSFWGAQVILNLPAAIPVIGDGLAEWVRGDYLISGITLNRFFALHVVAIPLVLVGLVFIHLVALHHVGSNNPDGVDIKKLKDKNGIPLDGVPFHPYYTVHDMVGIVVFFIIFFAVVFFFPEGGGFFLEKPNFEVANSLKTPPHIAPVWYYTPFYAILRAVPDKLGGVIAMGGAIAMLFLLPWLDRSPVKSIRYKGILSKIALGIFVVSFLVLGYLGVAPATPVNTILGRIFTILYFLYFLLMPIYTSIETCKQPPERVTGGH